MAVGHIRVDKSNPYQQEIQRILRYLQTGAQDLSELLKTFDQMKENGSVGPYMATQAGFLADGIGGTAVENATAGYDELAALSGKLNTDGSVTFVKTAISQASEKFA